MHLKTIVFTAGIVLGIIVGFVSPVASELGIAAGILAAIQLVVFIFEKRRPKGARWQLSLFTFLFACAIFFGVLRVQLTEERLPFVCEPSCTFPAKIVSSPERRDMYQAFIIRPLENEPSLDVLVRAPLYPPHSIGETLEVSGKVLVPDFIFPHADTKDNQKGFDYASYLRTKHVGSEMMFPNIEVIDAEAHTVPDYLGRWKEDMVSRIGHFVAQPASSLSAGMLFGDASMSNSMKDLFRISGLSHIVVLSGFNIALVIAFVLFVCAFLPMFIRIVIACVFVTLFVIMVGAEVSVVRATLMAFIALLAQLLGRQYVARQALILSLLLIIVHEPYALLKDVSLHLSFLATAGIVYLSDPIKALVERFVARRSVVELFTTTIAAYFATLPYIMHVFGTVSVYALLANIFALPLVPLAMLVSFVVVVTSYLSTTLSLFFGYVDTLLSNAIILIASFVERLPFASISVSVSFFTMFLLYGILGFTGFHLLRLRHNETPTTESGHYLTDIIRY